ncbi:MAG TPA: asparagine synthase (glutamine-hydrolyzing) [Acidobacteriota bacterium]|nr:asparagine synthase (glutamine-hydrolyzing) [Acidobacteriota bacterium]
MCGIAGIVFRDLERRPDPQMLQQMAAIMRHRGPDSEGFHTAPGIGLAVRRLSIIDTATGDQPIANEDGSIIVICNGEIYNYVELRERLKASGHRFRTQSDTEVIVHIYEEDPDGFTGQLRGMFGLAIWDAPRRRLVLARDRFGIKPLHYAVTPHALVFGSELKVVLASGLIAPAHDPIGMRDLFTFGFVRAPLTTLASVQRLLPGHVLTYSAGTIATKQYWDISFPHRDDYDRRRSAGEWAEALREKLASSVSLHLRSDVPVGAWLSGGIDSSAVTALMCRQLDQPVHSFTLGFDDPAIDELKHDRLLDQYPEYKLIGHRMQCQKHHHALLSRAVWHREQPFALGVDISQMLIAELAARQVKVVLVGEGSDENLGGYVWYRANKVLGPLANLPRPLRSATAGLLAKAGRVGAARIVRTPELNRQRFCAFIGSAEYLDSQRAMFADEFLVLTGTEPDNSLVPVPDAYQTWHPFAQLQYMDIKLRLAEMVIPHLDLLSMAYSLEARVPFLDHELAEFCATIPPWVKLRGFHEKDVLRRAMHGIVPLEICNRKKWALSAPTRDWIANLLPEYSATHLSTEALRERGYFNPLTVATILTEHQSGRADHSRLLMMILTTQMWDEQFMKFAKGAASCVTA